MTERRTQEQIEADNIDCELARAESRAWRREDYARGFDTTPWREARTAISVARAKVRALMHPDDREATR